MSELTEAEMRLEMLSEHASEEHDLVRLHAGDIRDLYDRSERLTQTLAIIALTLGDFRVRLETLERPSRWSRFVVWFKANVYSDEPIFTHTPFDVREL